jgi:hypothetical protein
VTRSEKRHRDAEIVRERAMGVSFVTIAERHEINERTVRRIVEKWWATEPATLEIDPRAVVIDTIRSLEQSIEWYALKALTAANETVQLGAMKARDEAFAHRIEVLRSLRLLPFDWQRWSQAQLDRHLFGRLVGVLARHPNVPPDVIEELRTIAHEEESQTPPILTLATKESL